MIKLASVTELETERLRPSFFRLPVVLALQVRPGRVQQPKRQVALRRVGLFVCRLGLPPHRQVRPQNKEWTLLLEVVLRSLGLCVWRLGRPRRGPGGPPRDE